MSSAAVIYMVGVDHCRPAKYYGLRLPLRTSQLRVYLGIETIRALDRLLHLFQVI